MYNLISLCWYSLKMNTVLKIHGYKKYNFHCHQTAIYLTMGYSLEILHVIEPRDTTGASPYPRLYPRILKALNNPYVLNNENKMFLTPKGIRSAHKNATSAPLETRTQLNGPYFVILTSVATPPIFYLSLSYNSLKSFGA